MDDHIQIKYDENSLCPHCKGNLSLGIYKKGFRIRCPKGHFKVYPTPGEIDPALIKRYFTEHAIPHLEEQRAHLDKWRSSFRCEEAQEHKES